MLGDGSVGSILIRVAFAGVAGNGLSVLLRFLQILVCDVEGEGGYSRC